MPAFLVQESSLSAVGRNIIIRPVMRPVGTLDAAHRAQVSRGSCFRRGEALIVPANKERIVRSTGAHANASGSRPPTPGGPPPFAVRSSTASGITISNDDHQPVRNVDDLIEFGPSARHPATTPAQSTIFYSRRAVGKPIDHPGFDRRIGVPVAHPNMEPGRVVHG